MGSSFEFSLYYFLKENDIIKELNSNVEYFYDYQSIINIQMILIDKLNSNFEQIYYSTLEFIKIIKNISEELFIFIYNNYQKIKLLKSLYDSNNDPVTVCNDVINNLVKGDLKYTILKDYYVPEYNKDIFNRFIEIVSKLELKISTNINLYNQEIKEFTKSKWYDSSFVITNLVLNNKYIDYNFDIEKIIGIKNFIIKSNYNTQNIDKTILPELIYKNENICREIFLLEENKYNKPISNITVIRQNSNIIKTENKIIINIFSILSEKILNYYLEQMSNYKMNFSIIISGEYLIYNYSGLDYIIDNYI